MFFKSSRPRCFALIGSMLVFTVGIKNSSGQDSDLYVGRLAAPIPVLDQVNFLRLTSLSEALLVGSTAYLYGTTARVGTGVINSFQNFGGDPITGGAGIHPTRTFTTAYAPAGGGNDAHFEGGDSGSPTFVIQNGSLALTGTHTAVAQSFGAFTNFDTSVSFYLDEVNAIVGADGFQVTTVPEPAVVALLAAGSLAFLVARRRRLG